MLTLMILLTWTQLAGLLFEALALAFMPLGSPDFQQLILHVFPSHQVVAAGALSCLSHYTPI